MVWTHRSRPPLSFSEPNVIQVKAPEDITRRQVCLTLFQDYPEIRGSYTPGVEPGGQRQV